MEHTYIVIEGPDASGKTSIAKELAKLMKAVPLGLHEDFWKIPEDTPDDFYNKQTLLLQDAIAEALKKGNVVNDRSAYSNAVFAFAYDGTTRIPPLPGTIKPTKLIYLQPPYEELRRRLNKRKNLSIHESDETIYKRLLLRYEELLQGNPDVIRFDNKGKTAEQSAQEIYNLLKACIKNLSESKSQ